MYLKAGTIGGAAIGGTGALLPTTGVSIAWLALAAFTLVATGFALIRLIPRRTT
jgi:hypothetical protein